MNVAFDIRGNLKPYDKIDLTFKELEQHFVESFSLSTSRRPIFSSYRSFVDAFKREITTDFIQWIDGSFVTRKTNPKDVDFVTLIDHQTYEEKKKVIESRFRREGARSAFSYVDAYVVKIYPIRHERRWVSEYDLRACLKIFYRFELQSVKDSLAIGPIYPSLSTVCCFFVIFI